MFNEADLIPVLWEQPCIYGFVTGGSANPSQSRYGETCPGIPLWGSSVKPWKHTINHGSSLVKNPDPYSQGELFFWKAHTLKMQVKITWMI